MARVTFVQRLAFEFVGTEQLAAVLKQRGHRVRLVIAAKASRAARLACESEPDVLCFSCTTGAHRWCLAVAERAKAERPQTLVLLGGPHPTFFPEILHQPQVDAICIGEGEAAIAAAADRVDRGQPLSGTPNLWHKTDGAIHREAVGPLVRDLDSLPWPDRSIYYRRYPHLNLSRKPFFAGRGCPFDCAFCFNRELRRIYKGLGPYVRWRSPRAVVDEIASVRRRHGLCTVYMQDDTFVLNKAWLADFAQDYARRVALPMVCLVRADLIDRDTVRLLRDMRCKSAFFGIESGQERVRGDVLNKPMSDDQIRRAASLLRSAGIAIRTYNMVGVPTEQLTDAWATVRLNAEIRPTFPWCAICQPYPRTQLRDLAEQMGLMPDGESSMGQTFFRSSPLALPRRREFENLHKLFFLAVRWPALQPLVRRLLRLPANPVFDLAFLLGYAYGLMRTERLRVGEVLSTALRNVGPFFLARGDGD